MQSSSFADRIGAYVVLTGDERMALDRLAERERTVRRSASLFRENDPVSDCFVLKSGLMMSSVILNDGSRQILRFIFPGDLVALSTLAYPRAPETVAAVTDSVVGAFDRAALARLSIARPRLFAAMIALDQVARVALADRMAALGRTSAKARVAAVLLEVRDRLRRLDPLAGDSFVPGLTQEEIGDATGLTAVHVNRMLRQLEEDGLIARDGARIAFPDERRLARVSNYVDRLSGIDLSWLPAAA